MYRKLNNLSNVLGLIVASILLISLQSCKTEYEKMVESELGSGVVHDSLIFDLKIGQTKKEFYKYCWDMNKSQKITAGSGNKYAKFVLPADSTDMHPDKINVQFFGMFDENDVMQGMEMKMGYYSWAPWLEQFDSDKLLLKIKDKMLEDYPGNDFVEIEVGEVIALVKVDGNRQISMYPITQQEIMVKIEDLRTKIS